jgi:hypothetical protein
MEQVNGNQETRSGLAVRSLRTIRGKALAVALSSSVIAGSVSACSGVGPPGRPVVFGDQTNIVIWDEAHHMEHFIRNANFKSGADDFGFIAPTPGKPKLSEASNQAFYTLASLAPTLRYALGSGGGSGGKQDQSGEVRVIQEADVAGFHATTVWSKDAHAINDWMNDHGYVSTPEVEKWAERYCARGWYLTAFKVVDRSQLAASTGTVRMSFKTRAPYNPFYVPSSNIPNRGKGTLRVYFVSVGNYDANIGPKGSPWQTPQWTSPIPDTSATQLATQVKLPEKAIPANAQVETFVDPDFPRPAADDIYFVKHIPSSPPKLPAHPQRGPNLYAMAPVLAGVSLLAATWRRRSGV